MHFDGISSFFWFFLSVVLIIVILAPVGTFIDILVKHITSGILQSSFLIINEIILFLIFAFCISYVDELFFTVNLTTYAEFSVSFFVFVSLYFIEKV